jgi:hypothetical protein
MFHCLPLDQKYILGSSFQNIIIIIDLILSNFHFGAPQDYKCQIQKNDSVCLPQGTKLYQEAQFDSRRWSGTGFTTHEATKIKYRNRLNTAPDLRIIFSNIKRK